MDAPEDQDSKFHRASASLLSDISSQLPKLLSTKRGRDGRSSPRLWVRDADTDRLSNLLGPFQEWPQLLDPHLKSFLSPMIDAFLSYMKTSSIHYRSRSKEQNSGASPLPRAICRLLYVFCKVRGVKVISRFFNNEARNLEPMLRTFINWEGNGFNENDQKTPVDHGLVWEERYVMLMWLSHLLLAPFDLKSISSDAIPEVTATELDLPQLPNNLPPITKSLLLLSFKYLVVPGKEREAASNLLARLALRPDMQRLGLLETMVSWALSQFRDKPQDEAPPVYNSIGILSFVARLSSSGEARDLASFIPSIFDTFRSVAQNEDHFSAGVRASASSRKLIIKILRSSLVLALSLGDALISSDTLSSMLEDAIDHFLTSLADQDTPVRFAASKALSVITLKLDPSMSADVVEAVIGSLAENLLWENTNSRALTHSTEIIESGSGELRPNLSAVNPLRWQGLILTLGQLLFRRSPPLHQLPQILSSLLSGLVFEQRLSTGTAVGVGVRDAANFGIWSLSRKYSTRELLNLDLTEIPQSKSKHFPCCQQLLAVELVNAACIDPQGNIRRGSSAALQELIGRHPDTILEGIPLVQAVDYHAVARRSTAMLEVAEAAAKLGDIYWESVLDAMLEWRGLGAPDADSRRTTAQAIGKISVLHSFEGLERTLKHLMERVSGLSSQAVELRHGYFLGLAAVIQALSDCLRTQKYDLNDPALQRLSTTIPTIWAIFEQFLEPSRKDLHSPALRPELTAECCSMLLSSLSDACGPGRKDSLPIKPPSDDILNSALRVISVCLSRTEDIAIQSSSLAASSIFAVLNKRTKKDLVSKWISELLSEAYSIGGGGRRGFGHIAALGAIYRQIAPGSRLRVEIFNALVVCIRPEKQLEFRVSALHSIRRGILRERELDDHLVQVIEQSLNDYTTDQRGDVGSLLRLEAIDCVVQLVENSEAMSDKVVFFRRLIMPIARLAAEKLDKVRFQAWTCLQAAWNISSEFAPQVRTFLHLSEVSSAEYFDQILDLTSVDWLRPSILRGFMTCAGAGSETTLRSSREALVKHVAIHAEQGHYHVISILVQSLLQVLEDNLKNDRYATPGLEVLAFIFSSGLVSSNHVPESMFQRCFILVQKAHLKSGNVSRLEAAVKVYSGLLEIQPLEKDVATKLTSMLLHPYPKVRAAVAESLFMHFESSAMRDVDWSLAPKELKDRVKAVRERIAVGS